MLYLALVSYSVRFIPPRGNAVTDFFLLVFPLAIDTTDHTSQLLRLFAYAFSTRTINLTTFKDSTAKRLKTEFLRKLLSGEFDKSSEKLGFCSGLFKCCTNQQTGC